MPEWSNWSGKLTASPEEIVFIRSEAEAAAVAFDAARQGRRIRAAGATHSHAPLVQHDGVIVDTSGLSGIISVDTANHSAWVWAGSIRVLPLLPSRLTAKMPKDSLPSVSI